MSDRYEFTFQPNPSLVDEAAEQVARPKVAQLTTKAASEVRNNAPQLTGALAASVGEAVEGSGAELQGIVTIGEDYWVYPEFGTKYVEPVGFVRRALFNLRGAMT